MAEPVQVVAAVFIDGDRVLTCRRLPTRAAGGKWEFPGGKVEPNESAVDALVREIEEELGIGIVVGALLNRTVTAADGAVIDLSCYRVESRRALPTRSRDHDRVEWVSLSAIAELDWAQPDRPMVEKLRAAAPPRVQG
jgi:8-oxo-dGTP diphosphatase